MLQNKACSDLLFRYTLYCVQITKLHCKAKTVVMPKKKKKLGDKSKHFYTVIGAQASSLNGAQKNKVMSVKKKNALAALYFGGVSFLQHCRMKACGKVLLEMCGVCSLL